MTDRELMQMTLDALDNYAFVQLTDEKHWQDFRRVIKALQARLAQPEPDFSKAGFGKPQNEEGCAGCGKKASKGWALYCVKCSEPVREWQTLTENEIKHLWYEACQTNLELTSQLIVHLARNIEAKLKEKNT